VINLITQIFLLNILDMLLDDLPPFLELIYNTRRIRRNGRLCFSKNHTTIEIPQQEIEVRDTEFFEWLSF